LLTSILVADKAKIDAGLYTMHTDIAVPVCAAEAISIYFLVANIMTALYYTNHTLQKRLPSSLEEKTREKKKRRR
jgi:hypothetical protein